MRYFVTGATGFIGSAIVRELTEAGHDVLGLARSGEAAASLTQAGVEVHRGALEDLDSLRKGAAAADGVVHTAFGNLSASTNLADSVATDRRAIHALGEVLEGSDRPFVVTSVTALLTPGRLATEQSVPDPGAPGGHRIASEEAALSFAAKRVQASVVRLPPSVHGEGDQGFVPTLVAIARAKGISAYPGDGANRWPAVHRLDAARLFRLALEAAPPGARLHAVGDEGVAMRDIAGVIGRRLELPVSAISSEQAGGHFGWLAPFVSLDNPASSALTQEQLGWQPTHATLLDDLAARRW